MGAMAIDLPIDEIVQSHRVVLFMKGTRGAPRCGFSASVVDVLDGLLDDYVTVDVLSDASVREGVKAYSGWPTLPQLFVDQKLVGGADIVREMRESGELEALLGVRAEPVPPPNVVVTPAAREALEAARQPGDGAFLRVEIDRAFEYGLLFDERRDDDVDARCEELALVLDPSSARRADGLTIDFVKTASTSGFRMVNPNEPPKVRALAPSELSSLLEAKAPLEIVDVRTPAERELARIEPSRLLDDAFRAALASMDPDTRLVFYCHHGIRSQAAAEHCVRLGFRNVWNLSGGLDAWSAEVDPDMPRY